MSLKRFCLWAREIEKRVDSLGFVAKLTALPESETESATDNPGAYLDIDTSEFLSRIALSDSGLCDVEIISSKSGENTYYKHIENCTNNFDLEFEEFFRILKIESVLTD